MNTAVKASAFAAAILVLAGHLPIGRASTASEALPAVSLSGETFYVELATTPSERRRGLMFRDHLPADRGMLFVYPEPQPVSFWNKNVPISLDILYFDVGLELLSLDVDVPPCLEERCPVYHADGPVKYVLELPGGTARRLGVRPGLRLDPRCGHKPGSALWAHLPEPVKGRCDSSRTDGPDAG